MSMNMNFKNSILNLVFILSVFGSRHAWGQDSSKPKVGANVTLRYALLVSAFFDGAGARYPGAISTFGDLLDSDDATKGADGSLVSTAHWVSMPSYSVSSVLDLGLGFSSIVLEPTSGLLKNSSDGSASSKKSPEEEAREQREKTRVQEEARNYLEQTGFLSEPGNREASDEVATLGPGLKGRLLARREALTNHVATFAAQYSGDSIEDKKAVSSLARDFVKSIPDKTLVVHELIQATE